MLIASDRNPFIQSENLSAATALVNNLMAKRQTAKEAAELLFQAKLQALRDADGPQAATVPQIEPFDLGRATELPEMPDDFDRFSQNWLKALDHFFDREPMRIFSGKTDEALRAMAIEPINWLFSENLMAVSSFLEMNDTTNLTPENGADIIHFRIAVNTEQQRIDAAKLTAEQMGADLLFNIDSIRNEIARALQFEKGLLGFSAKAVEAGGLVGENHAPSTLNFDLQLENLAAYSAFYQSKAKEYYSGADLDKIMETLDAEIQKGLQTVVNHVTGNGEARYMQADLTGIKESLVSLFDEYTNYYSGLLRDGTFDPGIAGTEYAWLEDSAVFVVGKLRNHADARNDLVEVSVKYGPDDVQAMAIMSRLSTVDLSRIMNEEQLGMMLGMDAVLLGMLEAQGVLSDAAKEQLHQSFALLKEKAIGAGNEQIASQRGDVHRDKAVLYDGLDVGAIARSIETMLKALESHRLAEGLQKSISNLLDAFDARQAAQYVNEKVQARYKRFDLTEKMIAELMKMGHSMETLQTIHLGLLEKNFGYREAASINALASFLGQPNRQVPARLIAYRFVATA